MVAQVRAPIVLGTATAQKCASNLASPTQPECATVAISPDLPSAHVSTKVRKEPEAICVRTGANQSGSHMQHAVSALSRNWLGCSNVAVASPVPAIQCKCEIWTNAPTTTRIRQFVFSSGRVRCRSGSQTACARASANDISLRLSSSQRCSRAHRKLCQRVRRLHRVRISWSRRTSGRR